MRTIVCAGGCGLDGVVLDLYGVGQPTR